jgi:hypothetical protein
LAIKEVLPTPPFPLAKQSAQLRGLRDFDMDNPPA